MIGRLPATAPPTTVAPHDLAYVIYTSGSTGNPKGVAVEHRNVRHILTAWDERYGLTELKPRFLSVSSLSVDLFFADLIRSVPFGGALVIASKDVTTDPAALLDLIARTGATGLEIVPSLLNAVLQEVERRGEDFPRCGWSRWAPRAGGSRTAATCCAGSPRLRRRQRLRRHRGHRRLDRLRPDRGEPRRHRLRPHRAASAQHPRLRPGRGAQPGPAGRARRDLDRRRGHRPRLPRPSGADGGTVHRQPLHAAATASTAPGTGPGGWPRGTWSSWAAPTTR